MGVFNRSYYEEVLVVRVHADRLLPPELRHDKQEWDRRFRMINSFENVLKPTPARASLNFFSTSPRMNRRNASKPARRTPTKNWKLAVGDFTERGYWDAYQDAFEKMLAATSTDCAPWYVIPANHKWARNYSIAHILAATMREMDPKMPRDRGQVAHHAPGFLRDAPLPTIPVTDYS